MGVTCWHGLPAADFSSIPQWPLGKATEEGRGHEGSSPMGLFAESARLIPAPVLPQIGRPPRLWLEHAEQHAVVGIERATGSL